MTPTAETPATPNPTFLLLHRYATYQSKRNLRAGTIYRHKRMLHLYLTFLGDMPPADATPATIEAFLDSRQLAPSSRYVYTSIITAFYDWMLYEEMVDANPAEKVVRPKAQRRLPRPAPDEAIQVALSNADERMTAWLLLAAYQGLRCHEIARLERDDFLTYNDPPLLVVNDGKGGHQRVLPLHPDVAEACRSFTTSGRWLFEKQGGGRYPAGTVSIYINRHLRGCGLPTTAHQLRHWFGTNIYRTSLDLRLTQEMLGHSDPKTTSIYTAFAPRKAASVLTGLDVRTHDGHA